MILQTYTNNKGNENMKAQSLLYIFLFSLLSFSFTACSDNDNEGINTALVGSWQNEDNLICFDTNGRGYLYEFASDGGVGGIYDFTYTYDESENMLTVITDKSIEGERKFKYVILTLTSNVLKMKKVGEVDGLLTYYRVE